MVSKSFKRYGFFFEGVEIPVSFLSIRRRLDTQAFYSVSIPDAQTYIDLFNSNPNGLMEFYVYENGSETGTLCGTCNLDQILSTNSPSGNNVVLNGVADFGTDLPTTGQVWIVDNPITTSVNSKSNNNFTAAEEPLAVVNDSLMYIGSAVSIYSISIYATVKDSRMDVTVT